MSKIFNIEIDDKINEQTELFMQKMNSEMYYKSELASNSISFDWVSELEFAFPYIDNIIRNPKLTLINESDVVKIEKARKISVESVKDLSKHTHYIEKIDPETNEVHPSKILILRREETFNTYENRFIYTLITNLIRFVMKKESLLENVDAKSDKHLEYAASTNTGNERINIELKISSKELPNGNNQNDFAKELEDMKRRVSRLKDYIVSWKRSEFMTSLDKAHAAFVIPPIKKTNMILKNPNFQIAMKLWVYLQSYDNDDIENSKTAIDTSGDDVLRGILDNSFLIDYFVFSSINSSKKIQRDTLNKYAVIMVRQQIQKLISLLMSNGINITDEEILKMISNEIKSEKNKMEVGSEDIKKKFKSAMDEYLERIQNCL